MKKITRFTRLLWLTMSALLLLSSNVNAEQMKQLGNWNVHYIAFGSTFITPEIAKSYGITRSKYKGLINISVLSSDKENQAQKVAISGTARNLLGNIIELSFKQVIEGKSIYYLAQIDYSNAETFNFNIELTQGERRETFTFSQDFYAE